MISAQRKISLGVVLALLAIVAASPARAEETPTFVVDSASHCSVGTFVPEPGLSVRWGGPCANGMAEGSGTVEWLKNGFFIARADGPYHSGLREGQFVITHPDRSTSVVAYHNGLPVLVFYVDPANHCSVGSYDPEAGLSVHWSGACVAGKADGAGIAEWQVNGAFKGRVEGEFRAGLPEGRAIWTVADAGQTYRWEAEFHNGRMNGHCVQASAQARVDGQCVDGKLNGPAIEILASGPDYDGGRYEGEFHDGHLTGRGVMTFANGSHYEGNFIDGVLTGLGRQVFPRENETYEGNLLNGKHEGTGVFHFHDGSVYEGEWHNNIPNGRGVWHSAGQDHAGTWVNGCLQGPYHAWLDVTKQSCGFN